MYKAGVLVLLLFIAGALAWPYLRSFTVDQEKLERVYRAAKTIEAGTGGDLTHAKLSELIQQFGTELLIARDKRPTPREVEMLDRYAEASGRDLSQIDYYIAFGYWKLACIVEGVYARYIGGAMGKPAAGFEAFGLQTVRLAEAAKAAVDRL